jgi:tetratricopeptide (TPR) repeat protein
LLFRVSQNHYQVLGVAANAPATDIKRAYRQLVVRYHPDKHGGDAHFEEQFKAVAAAYRVLSDPGRRATYDFQLAQAARRAEEQRRAQQYRPAAQHVYGVPMPPPAPLRTRRPADSRERHYRTIPRHSVRFNRRDWGLTLLIFLGMVLFFLGMKVTMDRVSARSNYTDGIEAYAQGQLATAYSFLDLALHFRPDNAAALQRRGELELILNHDPAAARADFQAALLEPQPPRVAASLLYHLGRCQAALGQPTAAELSYCRALVLDSTLSPAYLARGEGRLLDLRQPAPALADLNRGLRQYQQRGRGLPWHYVQVRGVALAALNRYYDARADYSSVLAVYPRDGRTHFLLGKLAQSIGDSTAACEFYRRALLLGYTYVDADSKLSCK